MGAFSLQRRVLAPVFGLMLACVAAISCTSTAPEQPVAEPESAATSPTTEAENADSAEEVGHVDADAQDSDPATATTESLSADASVASLNEAAAGGQLTDKQGNLIAVYGFSRWSDSFIELADTAQAEFPFFGDVDALADPSLELVVLDIGMCSAGIDAGGFGTAEFFVHDAADHELSSEPVRDRGVLAYHPVIHPSFRFPSAAECARGWLPVLWGGDGEPAIARYVLTTRSSANAEVERHVYQWELTELEQALDQAEDGFGLGQTVTFNDGIIEGTTVEVRGWAELIGHDATVAGTRVIAVSLNFCPATARLPEFGIAVDGWNVTAPSTTSDLLGALSADDVTADCFEGWLRFDVPLGGVPTAFFASDGLNAVTGYAEWSLENGALPAPS